VKLAIAFKLTENRKGARHTAMSATNCACPCPDPTVTEIPGSTGAAGADGADGANGVNAYTVTTSTVILPAAAGPVVLATSVAVSSWMAIGQIIFISDGTNWGHFEVLTLPSSTSVTLDWLQYPNDAAGTTVIASGATVSPAGVLPAFSPPADLTNSMNASAAAGAALAAGVGIQTLSIPLTSLVTGLGVLAIDLLTNYVPGYRFKILAFDFITTVAGTGAGASQVFNLEIGTTNLTGGVLTVNLAGTATIGVQTNGTAITANNVGTASDNISIEMAAGGTVFTAGAGYFLIKILNLDTADAILSLNTSINSINATL
jgi:hypothetical protein